MGVKFFGQFLVERGVISPESLLAAIELQEKTNRKFGEMALEMGLLTEEAIARVQAAQQREDLRFGDMAVKLGLLTELQMQQVLTRQKNSNLYIGRALVEVGALDKERLETELAEFQKDQAPYQLTRIPMPQGVGPGEIWEINADLTSKMLTRIAHLPHRSGFCRLVGEIEGNHSLAAITYYGTVKARYILSVSAGLRESIARAILRVPDASGEPEEVLDDALMEFVNIIAGNVAAKAAQFGHTLEIRPPEVFHPEGRNFQVPAGCIGLLFPLHVVSSEKIELALFVTKKGS